MGQEGRRITRPAPPPTFIDRPGLERRRSVNEIAGEVDQVAAADNLSDEPTESIALTIWFITVEAAEPGVDEQRDQLTARVRNLPPVVGSVGDVHELVGQMNKAGLGPAVRELRLVTSNGQAVTSQRGRNQPRVVATSHDPRAGRMNSLTMEQLGTLVELRPRIDAGRNIQVGVKIGESELVKSTEVLLAQPADGSPEFADVVTTRQFNTTASLKNNTAVVLQSVSASADGSADDATELIILGAAVVPLIE
jgi:hypothetical protein